MESQTRGCSNSAARLVATIFVLALTTIIGFFVGAQIAGSEESSVTWRSLGTPPEKAIKILDADVDIIYVQTTEGKIYSCRTWPTTECWVESGPPQHLWKCSSGYNATPVPAPSGKTVDRVNTWVCGELSTFASYVLNEDGKVWLWRYKQGGLQAVGSGMTTGAFVGFLIGIVISVFIWRSQ